MLKSDLRISFEQVGVEPAWVLLQPADGPVWRVSVEQWARLCRGQVIPEADGAPDPLWQEAARRALLLEELSPEELRVSRGTLAEEPLEGSSASEGCDEAPLGSRWLSRAEVEALELVSLPEARYRCEQCGESCRAGYEVGVLPPLEAEALARWVPPDVRLEVGGAAWQLLHREGTCALLDPVSRGCSLHAALGAEHKPRACRDFPLLLSLLPGGVLRLHLQWECTRLHRTGLVGSRWEGDRLEGLLSSEREGWEVLIPAAVVPVGDGRLISLDAYLGWESELLELMEQWSPTVMVLALPELVEGISRRAEGLRVRMEEILADTALRPRELLEELVMRLAPLIQALIRQGEELEPGLAWLSSVDRRRVYRAFVARQLRQWQAGGLPVMEHARGDEGLYRAWLRNRVFGLSLLRAPTLYGGALELGLRYMLAVNGMEQPPEVEIEGSVGGVAQRCLVAVEHALRQENLMRAYASAHEVFDDAAPFEL